MLQGSELDLLCCSHVDTPHQVLCWRAGAVGSLGVHRSSAAICTGLLALFVCHTGRVCKLGKQQELSLLQDRNLAICMATFRAACKCTQLWLGEWGRGCGGPFSTIFSRQDTRMRTGHPPYWSCLHPRNMQQMVWALSNRQAWLLKGKMYINWRA